MLLSNYHKFDLCSHIRDCHATKRNFQDILFCMPAINKWFPMNFCPDPRSHRETDSLPVAGNLHNQTLIHTQKNQ